MALRIQPAEVEISDDPNDDPFANDLLGRRQPIEALTNVIANIEGPCVVAVDAGWGMGKTTFLRFWVQHLRNKDFPVLEFNAWETDFALDPLVALSTEMSATLSDIPGIRGGSALRRLQKASAEFARVAARPTARYIAASLPGFGAELAKDIAGAASTSFESAVTEYSQRKRARDDFRERLKDLASAIPETTDGHPLVVIVDELDRCRPTYAIELLETTKHLLSVDHIVFILCLDRTQLAHSVKAVYGSEFAAEGYLRRFFDIDYALPRPHRASFVRTRLDDLGIRSHLQNSDLPRGTLALELLTTWLEGETESLRRSLQAIHRLALVLASMTPVNRADPLVIVVMAVLRSCSPSAYSEVLSGTTTDMNVVERFFESPAVNHLRNTTLGINVEGILIGLVAWRSRTPSEAENPERLPRLRELREFTTRGSATFVEESWMQTRLSMVLQAYSRCCAPYDRDGEQAPLVVRDVGGMEQAIERLELFQYTGEEIEGT